MHKLTIAVLGLVALLFAGSFTTVADAGQRCSRNISCASEDRSVTKVAVATKKVSVTIDISPENWKALNAYWRAKGYSGRCFWWASSRQGDKTAKIYGRSGTVTLYKGREYAYNGRVHWEYFGPY